jgi:hypothetical protein
VQHSTETALLKVHSDIAGYMDTNKAVLLVLLDLSAAFDTIHHDHLLATLHSSFGIDGIVLTWFQSYIRGRSQSVSIGGVSSKTVDITFGVPQGSVLGPVLFSLYTKPLQQIIEKHRVEYHKYADDVQLYISYDPDNTRRAANIMCNCIIDIKNWMIENYLQLNDDKTELINIMSPYHLRTWGNVSVALDSITICPSVYIKNLGVFFDQYMTMGAQVSAVTKSSNYHLRNIGKVRKYLSTDACKTAVQTLVVSRLDYCSALLSGITVQQVTRLQLTLNKAARLITLTPRSEHITSVLAYLHWLPCRLRIQFRILT